MLDYNARFYDPRLGRFVSADTMIPDPGNPLDWDRYGYINNNPVNGTDPSGHCAIGSSLSSPFGIFSVYASCVQDMVDAYHAYQSGETKPGVLYAEATGIKDALVSTANAVHQMNSDVSTVFSDAPLAERILPSVRVGTFAVGTAATFVGAGQLTVEGANSTLASRGINANEYGPASSYTNWILLQKQLASQQQMGETGSQLSGAGTKTLLRDASRLADQYGGNPSDWAKMGSSSYTAWDGTQFETHWYKNLSTGFSTEINTKITAIVKSIAGVSIK